MVPLAASRAVVDLRPERLPALPEPCRSCLFWEESDAARGAADVPGEAQDAKQAWWQAAQLEWGVPGRAVFDGDRLVAYAVSMPVAQTPRARQFGVLAPPDSVLLATVWVEPARRGEGLGKLLVQSTLSAAVKRRARVVLAVGGRGPVGGGTCMVPEGFLLAHGFSVHREHPLHPVLRLELRQTVRDSVEQALAQVRRALTVVEGVPRTASSPSRGPVSA